MVRFTLKRSLRDASCWSVEVINGATGLRFFSRVPTDLTTYAAPSSCSTTAFADSPLPISGVTSFNLMSRAVSASEQGQLQGANASLTGIANLIGPGLFTLTFAYAIGAGRGWSLPGAPFLISTLLVVVAAIVAWRMTRVLLTPRPQVKKT